MDTGIMSVRKRHYIGGYWVWFSEGDFVPYWVSDEDGAEINSFRTFREACIWAEDELENEGLTKEFTKWEE